MDEQSFIGGNDPRDLPDFQVLQSEIAKLQYGRQRVNWSLAEECCLQLAKQNGLELQTAAWYTLVRTKCAGIPGLNEGLSLIESLFARHWRDFWPPAAHARGAILGEMSHRLQNMLRHCTLTLHDRLPAIEAAARVERLYDKLEEAGMGKLSQVQALKSVVDGLLSRIEQAVCEPEAPPPVSGEIIPAGFPEATAPDTRPLVVMSSPVSVNIAASRQFAWQSALAGAMAALLIGGLGGWLLGSLSGDEPDSVMQRALAPLPEALSSETQADIVRSGALQEAAQAEKWLTRTRQQLEMLGQVSPVWLTDYGATLVHQTRTLWPTAAASQQVAEQWHQHLESHALPVATLQGWRQANDYLTALEGRLNQMDGHKGRYITGSELKTVVYNVRQSLNTALPLEEKLRRVSEQQTVTGHEQADIDNHFRQLLYRYALLKSTRGE